MTTCHVGVCACVFSKLSHGWGIGLPQTGQFPPEEGRAASPGPRPGRRHQQHPGSDQAGCQAEEGTDAAGAAASRQDLPPLGRRSDPQHPRGSEENQGGVTRVRVRRWRPSMHWLGELVCFIGRMFLDLWSGQARFKRPGGTLVQFEQKPMIFFFSFYIRSQLLRRMFFHTSSCCCKDGPLIFFFFFFLFLHCCCCCGIHGEDTTSNLSLCQSRTVACCDGFVAEVSILFLRFSHLQQHSRKSDCLQWKLVLHSFTFKYVSTICTVCS